MSSTRTAALIATAVAVPVMAIIVVASVLGFGGKTPDPGVSTVPVPVGPVAMDAPALDDATATLCRAVIAHLPDTVLGQARRPVSAGAEQNAAYGEPPVTLACATAAPTVGLTDEVYPLSGVCWLPTGTAADGGTIWSTVDRQVPVQVVVPGDAAGSSQTVIVFSAAVGGFDPASDSAPTGCQ